MAVFPILPFRASVEATPVWWDAVPMALALDEAAPVCWVAVPTALALDEAAPVCWDAVPMALALTEAVATDNCVCPGADCDAVG